MQGRVDKLANYNEALQHIEQLRTCSARSTTRPTAENALKPKWHLVKWRS